MIRWERCSGREWNKLRACGSAGVGEGPMKIALVSPYDFVYPGGVTNHILPLRDEFVRRGHTVRIIAPSSRPASEITDPDVLPIGRPYPIPANGSIARITLSLRLSNKVKAVLERENFDVVHLHEPLMLTLPLTVLRLSRAVNVGTFHGYADRNLAYFYGRRMLKRWFRRLDGKIAVSRPARDFVSWYFPGYYNIIPNGIDVARYGARVAPMAEYRDGKVNILFLGRLEQRKGLKYLIRAFATIKRQTPDSRLIVIGTGPLLAEYRRAVEASGLQDVVFTGFVSEEDKVRLLHTADVYVAPATGGESFGIVLLEAMAAGAPIVASDIPGFASVLTDGQEGLLVPPKNEAALASAIIRLLADPGERQRMGTLGRLTAQEYGWEQVSARVLAYYQRLLNEREQARSQPVIAGAGSTRRFTRFIPNWLHASPRLLRR